MDLNSLITMATIVFCILKIASGLKRVFKKLAIDLQSRRIVVCSESTSIFGY